MMERRMGAHWCTDFRTMDRQIHLEEILNATQRQDGGSDRTSFAVRVLRLPSLLLGRSFIVVT
jgi:hypothetical protein